MVREPIDPTDASLDDPLDDALAAALPASDGDPSRDATVRDWVDAARDAVAGSELADRALAVDDLCHDTDGDHVAVVADGPDAGEYRFRCFLDGLVLAGLVDEPVTVTTHSPATGDRVTFAGPLDALETDAAVVSLGAAADAVPATDGGALACECGPDCCGDGATGDAADDATATDEPAASVAYDAVCPYVNAFASRDAYERWRETVDAATTAVSPAVAVAVARELAA